MRQSRCCNPQLNRCFAAEKDLRNRFCGTIAAIIRLQQALTQACQDLDFLSLLSVARNAWYSLAAITVMAPTALWHLGFSDSFYLSGVNILLAEIKKINIWLKKILLLKYIFISSNRILVKILGYIIHAYMTIQLLTPAPAIRAKYARSTRSYRQEIKDLHKLSCDIWRS